MNELEQITLLLERMGAEGPQAKIMAGQLLKRAEQLAEQRGCSRVEALAGLLEVVKSGRAGEVPDSQED